MSELQNKFSRRSIALMWIVAIGVVISILIYLELISVLYVLATVALVALLLIVGFSDLESVGRENIEGFAVKEE